MNFSNLFYRLFRCFLLSMLFAPSFTKTERTLLFRSDDERSCQNQNVLSVRENLNRYDRFSPTWQPHAPVKNNLSTPAGARDSNRQYGCAGLCHPLSPEELRQALQVGIALDIYRNLSQQPEWVDSDTRMFYEDDSTYDNSRFIKRAQAEAAFRQGNICYGEQSYTLSREAATLLRNLGVHGVAYHVCFGTQLQQVIHQECVDLIERTAQLKQDSPIFEYQESMVYCIDAAQIYNKSGQTYNASVIVDFCYTLLDYGKAVLEGARDGLFGIAQQSINDPLQAIASATLSVAAGEYLLAYQLGKIVYGVLNLTVNAVINPEQAQKTWDGYVTPISGLIDALKNKQISLRDGIRAGTALAVSMKAQSMLAKGCEKMYSMARTRALKYIAKNPLAHPEHYMEMGDNFAFKLANDRKIEWAKYRNKHNPPKNVDWKDIVKQTKHGHAKYKPEIDREKFERMAWEQGTPVTNGRTWKVMKSDYIVGAKNGEETPYVRVEMSANTIHGHPITLAEYRKLLKNEQS